MIRKSSRFLHTIGLFALALAVAAPGCGKKGKGAKGPGGSTKSAAEVAKEVEAAKKEAKSQSLVDLANKDLAAGRYVSATKRAEEALQSNPQNADAHAILGAARWRAGDYDASTAAYRKALEIDAKNYGAGLGLSRNLQAAGQHEEAAKIQEKMAVDHKDQVDPRLTQLWSYYALGDADSAVKVLDEIFKQLPANDPLLPLVQYVAAYVRPLKGKGPFFTVKGEAGSSDANINVDYGLKYSGADVAGEFAQVVFFELREETFIDDGMVKKLKLKEVGKIKPLGADKEVPIVIIPAIKFGKLTLENVPAVAQSLEGYASATGETPGVMLGRQAMHALGAITFDFPAKNLTIAKDAPKEAPKGTVELPFLLVSNHALHAPAVPITINGSPHRFFVYLGGIYKSGVAVSKKHYLKSGRLPREVEAPEDADNGLKMVYVDKLALGERVLPGVGALVLVNTPPDQNLGSVVESTAFELGGYVNVAMMANWKLTYALSQGKVFVDPGA
jgi:tetratricopeptide (TPR) repeat protein